MTDIKQTVDVNTSKTGILGLGTMGARLAAGLQQAGREIVGYDASPAATQRAADSGIQVVDTLAQAAAAADAFVLSLPTPGIVLDVVEQLCLARPATAPFAIYDTSTIDPGTAKRAATHAAQVGGRYVDCPILGRPTSVGSWTFPVGGEPSDATLAAEVLGPVAGKVTHVGPTGAASTIKILNNLMLGTINAVTAELLLLAETAGLDPGTFVDLVVSSAAASVSPMFRDVAARAVDGDFTTAFSVRLMHKDNGLALALADELSVPIAVGNATQQLNTMAMAAGLGDEDSIAVLKALELLTGRSARRKNREPTQ